MEYVNDIIPAAIALVIGYAAGVRVSARLTGDDIERGSAPIGVARETPNGACVVREFTYDGSDGIRRQVDVHASCDKTPLRDPLKVAALADKKLALAAPGIPHRLICVRDREHEA